MYHPTDMSLAANHCNYAVKLKYQRTPYDRDIFQAGVAAHAVIENVGKLANQIGKPPTMEQILPIAKQTAIDLASEGRAYDKHPEPPMKVSQAIDGKNIALTYLRRNPLDPKAEYEMPVAFDEDWNAVKYYDDKANFRTILDFVLVENITDEDGDSYQCVTVRDYKSSWHIPDEHLDNIQRRAQAVSAWLMFPDASVLKMQIHGLRFQKKLERTIFVQQEFDTLEQWKDDIDSAVKALKRVAIASPGIGCLNCPFTLHCNACQQSMLLNKKDPAQQYLTAQAIMKSTEKYVREITKEKPIKHATGMLGYQPKERTKMKADAPQQLLSLWTQNNGDLQQFLKVSGISITNAKKIIKLLQKQGLDYDTIWKAISNIETYTRFGVHKT